jgi:predicted RecA/RadA family phage recombinase
MSTNQVQPGKSVLVTAGGTVASGSVQEVGSDFIGVALGAATSGTDYQLALEGVFNIAQKTSETWSQGDKIYWDRALPRRARPTPLARRMRSSASPRRRLRPTPALARSSCAVALRPRSTSTTWFSRACTTPTRS